MWKNAVIPKQIDLNVSAWSHLIIFSLVLLASPSDELSSSVDFTSSSDSSPHFVAPSSTSVRPLQLGVLGCMAERLKTRLVEETKVVDVVCGPDAYRDLPRMLASTPSGHAGVNVLLSLDETYADVMPVGQLSLTF